MTELAASSCHSCPRANVTFSEVPSLTTCLSGIPSSHSALHPASFFLLALIVESYAHFFTLCLSRRRKAPERTPSCSLLWPQRLEQSLAHSRCSINICRVNDRRRWRKQALFLGSTLGPGSQGNIDIPPVQLSLDFTHCWNQRMKVRQSKGSQDKIEVPR